MNQVIRIERNRNEVAITARAVATIQAPGVRVRVATGADFPWIDALQKQESSRVGFLPASAIMKRIEQGNVIVAEGEGLRGSGAQGLREGKGLRGSGAHGPREEGGVTQECSPSAPQPLSPSPLGYLIGVDRYYRNDHVGIIYQVAVVPEARRSLVAAMLVQAQFDKSAYGVRLYCLWCRQDLEANRFWEALGFVPIAFRAGSRGATMKGADGRDMGAKIHILWQKRIRPGDTTTDWWYPSLTQGGAMMEDRVVLPIPAGTHWSDAKPAVLPGAERRMEAVKLIEMEVEERVDDAKAAAKEAAKAAKQAAKRAAEAARTRVVHGVVSKRAVGGMGFGPTPAMLAAEEAERKEQEKVEAKERVKRERKEARKEAKRAHRGTSAEVAEFSREVRDRWQEWVKDQPLMLGGGDEAKYDVRRLLEEGDGARVMLRGAREGDVIPRRRALDWDGPEGGNEEDDVMDAEWEEAA